MRPTSAPNAMNPHDLIGRLRSLTFRACLMTALLATLGGCAERGRSAPRIDRQGRATSDRRDDSIRVATANLWGVSVLGLDWADEIDIRFAEMAERLGANEPRLDLVLIQEAWKDSARRSMLAHPGVIKNFPHRVDALEQPGGSGLVVLSRFPIERAEFHRFEEQGRCYKFWEGDCLSGKGVLAVQVLIEDQLLWVGSTHLIACYANDEDAETDCDQHDPNGDVRWSQLVEARRFMEDLSGRAPSLLGGDFNLTRSSRYYPGMTSRTIPHDPPLMPGAEAKAKADTVLDESSKHNDHGWTESGDQEFVAQRIDYLWTRPGDRLRWRARGPTQRIFTELIDIPSGESIPISDHPILAVSFCLAETPDGSESTICEGL